MTTNPHVARAASSAERPCPASLILVLTLWATAAVVAGCGGSADYSRHAATASGGAPGPGSGGAVGSGGSSVASGGGPGSGGAIATGGTGTGVGSGGTPGSGGGLATGGAGSGGAPGTGGGAPGSGGSPAIGTGGAATGGRGAGGAGTGGAATGGAVVATGGAGTGGAATGGAGTGGAATGGAGTGGAPADPARYNFESTVQAWGMATGTTSFTSIARDTGHHFAGAASLAGAITATATGESIYQLRVAPDPPVPANATVTAHVYVPAGSTISWLQVYLQEAAPSYAWTGTATSFTAGSWTTLTVTAPSTGGAIGAVGVQFHLTGPWTGTVYVDSVNW